MRWAGACGEKKCIQEKSDRKSTFGEPRHGWKNNVKMYLK
jgi:hypothetical protein